MPNKEKWKFILGSKWASYRAVNVPNVDCIELKWIQISTWLLDEMIAASYSREYTRDYNDFKDLQSQNSYWEI